MSDSPPAAATPSVPRLDRRLIGLNIGLLAVLGGVTLITASRTGAQPHDPNAAAPARGRGEYTMISGRVQGLTTSGIYVLDAANQEIVALSWDRNNNRAEIIGYRNLDDDTKFMQRPR